VFYLDTSALAKLVLDERESQDLESHLGMTRIACSQIALTELRRAVLRRSPDAGNRIDKVLARLDLVSLSVERLTLASTVPPPTLRSLDAIHLATALTLRDELEAFVAYDSRLLEAASALGLPVASPGV
jgi:predicted nucleic acid-binding protein